ncbi:MAG: Glu/Leu/Phe/Val dehydrogenase [Candidatus Nealsonbacteria bacterium]|nr:Glu/Leu/Phe/Val dehydrogenase [Candidatus Nealsonbacteria bacterium]
MGENNGVFERMLENSQRKLEVRPDLVPYPEAEWIAEVMRKEGHERIYLFYHPEVKLKTAIAIHNRAIAEQALGGIRMLQYRDEKEAITDVLRLSKAMTYKAAIAGIKKGGAKCVVWGNPREDKTNFLLWELAEEIEALRGEYIGGEDMNIDEQDVRLMRMKTSFVAGLPETYRYGKLRGSGDPSPVTARGIVYGMKACLRFLNMGPLEGKTVAIQGLGKVGYRLAEFLYQEGVKQIIGSDIDPRRIAHFQEELKEKALGEFKKLSKVVAQEEIFSQECDIFAPCAAGGILTKQTVSNLRCRIVAGAANNQLQDSVAGKLLMKKGILYAPDYVINAGGLINVDDERHPDGYSEVRVQEKLESIFPNLMKVFWYSKRLNLPTNIVADMLAEEKIYLAQILR